MVKRKNEAPENTITKKQKQMEEEKTEVEYVGRQNKDAMKDVKIKALHKTDDILIIDKPFDVHIDGKSQVTVEKLVNEQYPEMLKIGEAQLKRRKGEQERRKLKFCHQLDYATSGVMCLAFTRRSCASVATCFQNRTARKSYLAVVFGHIENKNIFISAAIQEDENDLSGFKMRTTTEGGKESETSLTVLSKGVYTFNNETRPVTKVLLKPKSGRRHQLRLHTKHIGHPIVGDATYAEDLTSPRMMLHAYRLFLPLPSGELNIEAKDPFTNSTYFNWEQDK
ncbi:rpusd1 [Acrasis kona]|uniref:Rpusd1 n=1 Tax=Acrasis kona TaxID=1008807 RepID=A0AAW2Z6R6_9EUKA